MLTETDNRTACLAEAVYDLTLTCSDELMRQHERDSRTVFNIIHGWAQEFEAWWNTLPEDEQQDKDYILEIDAFAQKKLGNSPYWPLVRRLNRMLHEDAEPGYAIPLQLPALGEVLAIILEKDHDTAILLCSGFTGDWHRAVVIPEDQFDEPHRVLDALVWFDTI